MMFFVVAGILLVNNVAGFYVNNVCRCRRFLVDLVVVCFWLAVATDFGTVITYFVTYFNGCIH